MLGEIGNTPRFKKLRRDALRCCLIRNMLGAVFTKLKIGTLTIGFRPGTTGTVDTAGWFIFSSVRAPRINPISDQLLLSVEIIAGMPPAILLIESISTDDFSSGGCAEGSV